MLVKRIEQLFKERRREEGLRSSGKLTRDRFSDNFQTAKRLRKIIKEGE